MIRMDRRVPVHQEGHHNHERWLLTYADMITLLTAFFLMLYSMSVMNKNKFQEVAASVRSEFGGSQAKGKNAGGGTGKILDDPSFVKYENALADLRKYVEQNRLGKSVSVSSDQRGVVITLLSDGTLFKSGQAVLMSRSIPLLQHVAKVLSPLPNDVLVEGHTDNKPIHTAQFPSNWNLSTSRAVSVLRFFTDKSDLQRNRFSAAGYADTRPLVPNDTPQDRAKNRRVDIVILKTRMQQQADLLRQAEINRVVVNNAGTSATNN